MFQNIVRFDKKKVMCESWLSEAKEEKLKYLKIGIEKKKEFSVFFFCVCKDKQKHLDDIETVDEIKWLNK